MSLMQFISVVLLSPPYSTLTYSIPAFMPPNSLCRGIRLAVPLGAKSLRVAVAVDISSNPPNIDLALLRPIIWPLEKAPILDNAYLTMIEHLALRQAMPFGHVLASALPFALKAAKGFVRSFENSRPELYDLKALSGKDDNFLATLASLWQNGRADFVSNTSSLLETELCTVYVDPPFPVRPNAKNQIEMLNFLWEDGPKTRRVLLDKFGPSSSLTINALVTAGLLQIGLGEARPKEKDKEQNKKLAPHPTPAQNAGQETNDISLKQNEEEALSSSASGSASASEADSLESFFAHLLAPELEGAPFQQEDSPLNRPHPLNPLHPLHEGEALQVKSIAGQPLRTLSQITFSPQQSEAINKLSAFLPQKKANVALLHGITGSGKTIVYIELARRALEAGRSVLLLAPEVSLAYKLFEEAKNYLPDASTHIYHGYQSPTVKESIFRHIAKSASPLIVVGTRSALLTPLTNIGLIVLDEEHDSSFKQDEGLVYQAKDIAYFRALQNNALLLLGSATPDVRSFYSASEGDINLCSLDARIGGSTLPALEFVDISKQHPTNGVLAKRSLAALNETIKAGQQAVIILNRRGHSPVMYCLACGHTIRCPHCEISMTYHKIRQRMVCHYCAHSTSFPCFCSHCNSSHYLPMGEGTEKMEETLLPLLPAGTKVLRLDKDTTRRKGSMQEILCSFAKKEADVLIGTQMLSKGHHFPGVTLAIVADADIGLNLPEYQAAERTFQLMVQSAGRSGRGKDEGLVLIQTRDPSHFCWKFVRNSDYQGFYEKEIEMRRRRKYPPFSKIALIRVSFPSTFAQGADETNKLALRAKKAAATCNVTVMGPAQAPLATLKGRKRFHCLLKGETWSEIRAVFIAALKGLEKGSKKEMRVSLDIDPSSMM